MSDADDFYPPTPTDVPADLTKPTGSYRLRVVVVLTSLLLFVALYFGLVVGSAYLCYWCFATLGAPAWTPSPNRDQLMRISQAEDQILRTFDETVKKFQANTIDETELLRILETDVLPRWRAERQRLDQITGASTAEERVLQPYRQSFALQEESWELFRRALGQRDRNAGDLANQKMQEAAQLAHQASAAANSLFRPPPRRGSDNPTFFQVILGIVSGLLCLFLVKGFFKWQRADASLRVEVTEAEQPVLFAFIRRICRDTRAAAPHRVYLTPDVNAAVFYNESLLSLFLPTPKNLVIGLGLVNRLTLSEFKAVLAHEFGHFSQSSMKLGSYVYRSNRIIADLVYRRDWLDQAVSVISRIDIRIAVFAWAFMGILWLVRKGLQGLFRLINFANTALSRQMEFNADLVAVSVTGSDALVHGLARLDLATDALTLAWNDLTAASDHQLYTRDIFYHQTKAAEYLRSVRKDPRLGEPPPLSDDPREITRIFQPEDTSVPRMWATHPSNHDREANAKSHYIRTPLDERSPWLLFENGPAVRETVTRRTYEVTRKLADVELKPPEIVQAFIDDEHAEMTYDARYCGLYDNRYLTPGEFQPLLQEAASACRDASQFSEARARIYGDEMKTRMAAHHGRNKEQGLLANLVNGAVALTRKDFAFRGGRHPARDAKRLLAEVQEEISADFKWMEGLDRESFLVHHAMASRLGADLQWDLEERYRFHMAVQDIHFHLAGQHRNLNALLGQIAGQRELSQEQFQNALGAMRIAHQMLRDKLDAAQELRLPAMKNLAAGDPLSSFLLSKPLIRALSGSETSLDGQWIGKFLEQLSEVLDKTTRIHFKSLGGVLALQNRISERWEEKQAALAEAQGA